MAFCKYCGSQLEDGAAFCGVCGKNQGDDAPQQVAPTASVYSTPYGVVPQAPYGVPPVYSNVSVPGKGLGVASMVLGIISLVLFCIWYIAIPCGIVAACLGGASVNKAKAVGQKNGLATAGIVCSCIALGITTLYLVIFVWIVGATVGAFSALL